MRNQSRSVAAAMMGAFAVDFNAEVARDERRRQRQWKRGYIEVPAPPIQPGKTLRQAAREEGLTPKQMRRKIKKMRRAFYTKNEWRKLEKTRRPINSMSVEGGK